MRNAAEVQAEAEGAAAAAMVWGVPGDSPVGLGGGPVRAESLGHHIRATLNQHEQECTQTCCCRACWNGTGTASSRASWNGSCRNVCKYAKNMQ